MMLEYMNLGDGNIFFKEIPRSLVGQLIEELSMKYNERSYESSLQPADLFRMKSNTGIVIQDLGDLQSPGGALLVFYMMGPFAESNLEHSLEKFYERNDVHLALERYEVEKYKPVLA